MKQKQKAIASNRWQSKQIKSNQIKNWNRNWNQLNVGQVPGRQKQAVGVACGTVHTARLLFSTDASLTEAVRIVSRWKGTVNILLLLQLLLLLLKLFLLLLCLLLCLLLFVCCCCWCCYIGTGYGNLRLQLPFALCSLQLIFFFITSASVWITITSLLYIPLWRFYLYRISHILYRAHLFYIVH